MPSMETINLIGHYILDEQGNPVEETDILKWSKWFAREYNRPTTFTHTTINGLLVSTVFLGVDHTFLLHKIPRDPELWETMIFTKDKGGRCFPGCIYTERYSTKKDAETGHNKACELAKLGEEHILSLEDSEE